MFEVIAWGVAVCVALSFVGCFWTVVDPDERIRALDHDFG